MGPSFGSGLELSAARPGPSTSSARAATGKKTGGGIAPAPRAGRRQPTRITTLPLEPRAEADRSGRPERVRVGGAPEGGLSEVGVRHQEVGLRTDVVPVGVLVVDDVERVGRQHQAAGDAFNVINNQ